MDPYVCAEQIAEFVTKDRINDACEFAIALIDWQRKGGFMPISVIQVLNPVWLNVAASSCLEHRPLKRLLEAFIREYFQHNPPPSKPVPIVDDYETIAAGLRRLERERMKRNPNG